MKKLNYLSVLALSTTLMFSACKKEECYECHYDDANGDEVELGEKCGDEIGDLETSGHTTGGVTYTVHCGEEH
ncbi:MAG: hypothetical protein HOB26_10005 [Flavobacteriales bacterium]|jgi:hypothetical protein|nr:hypothetical protein [Flavobacteriales bacterium]MBT6746878.1 hypothetical protein [Flavobacteriales bacterium]